MKAPITLPPARAMDTSNPVEAIGCSGPVQPTLIKKKELAKRLSVRAPSTSGPGNE
jgi:hypothetical protein